MAEKSDSLMDTCISSGLDFKQFQVNEAPDSVFCIPNFVTEEEEEYLLRRVNDAPKPKWTQLSNRRLQNWGGDPHPKGMITEPLPEWLKIYVKRIADIPELFPSGRKPNHVLINEYLPGQGIMPHLDGPLFHPIITTISLGSHTVLNFYKPMEASNDQLQQNPSSLPSSTSWSDRLQFKLLVEPRSLLILMNQAYEYYLHGIEEITQDVLSKQVLNSSIVDEDEQVVAERATRVSLTIRHVPGAKASILKLLGKK